MVKYTKELREMCFNILKSRNIEGSIKEKRSSNATRPITVETYLE